LNGRLWRSTTGIAFDYYDIEQDSPRAAIAIDERIARQIEVLIDSIVGRRRSCSSASAAS